MKITNATLFILYILILTFKSYFPTVIFPVGYIPMINSPYEVNVASMINIMILSIIIIINLVYLIRRIKKNKKINKFNQQL
ncbi:hypothetical protein D0T87_08905 [Bacteroides sp. 51]|nr:hypothetical protein [Bacteroides sp. 51]